MKNIKLLSFVFVWAFSCSASADLLTPATTPSVSVPASGSAPEAGLDLSNCQIVGQTGYDGSLYNVDGFNTYRVIQGNSFHAFTCPPGTAFTGISGYETKGDGGWGVMSFGARHPRPSGGVNIRVLCCSR